LFAPSIFTVSHFQQKENEKEKEEEEEGEEEEKKNEIKLINELMK